MPRPALFSDREDAVAVETVTFAVYLLDQGEGPQFQALPGSRGKLLGTKQKTIKISPGTVKQLKLMPEDMRRIEVKVGDAPDPINLACLDQWGYFTAPPQGTTWRCCLDREGPLRMGRPTAGGRSRFLGEEEMSSVSVQSDGSIHFTNLEVYIGGQTPPPEGQIIHQLFTVEKVSNRRNSQAQLSNRGQPAADGIQTRVLAHLQVDVLVMRDDLPSSIRVRM